MTARTHRFSIARIASTALFLGVLAPCGALAGDAFAPAATLPDQGHCKALGDGFYAVKGSDTCIRISGYIAAGVEFAGPGRVERAAGPFAERAGAETDTRVGISMDARFDTELGPGRLYVQVGRDHVQP
jgi:hypothetical protein